MQRLLQARIEAQGRYLHSILRKAEENLATKTLGLVGMDQARLLDITNKEVCMDDFSKCGAMDECESHIKTECSFDSSITNVISKERYETEENGGLEKKYRGDLVGDQESVGMMMLKYKEEIQVQDEDEDEDVGMGGLRLMEQVSAHKRGFVDRRLVSTTRGFERGLPYAQVIDDNELMDKRTFLSDRLLVSNEANETKPLSKQAMHTAICMSNQLSISKPMGPQNMSSYCSSRIDLRLGLDLNFECDKIANQN